MIDNNILSYNISTRIRETTLRGRAATEELTKSDKIIEFLKKGLTHEDIDVQDNCLISLQRIKAVGGKAIGDKLAQKDINNLNEIAKHPKLPNQSLIASLAIASLIITNYDLVQSVFKSLPPYEQFTEKQKEMLETPGPLFNTQKLLKQAVQTSIFGFFWGAARWYIALKRGKPLLLNISVLRGAGYAALGSGGLSGFSELLGIFKKKVLDKKKENTVSFTILNWLHLGSYATALYATLAFAPYSFAPSLLNTKITHDKRLILNFSPEHIVMPKKLLPILTK